MADSECCLEIRREIVPRSDTALVLQWHGEAQAAGRIVHLQAGYSPRVEAGPLMPPSLGPAGLLNWMPKITNISTRGESRLTPKSGTMSRKVRLVGFHCTLGPISTATWGWPRSPCTL